jgi:hypothetical protein
MPLIRSIPAIAGWFSRRKGGLPRLIPSLLSHFQVFVDMLHYQ